MENYVYTALPYSQCIRLIAIDAAGPNDGALRCRFTIAHITALPPYTALSYVWGDTTHTCPILVDGRPFSITQSLADALRRMARTPGTLLWADALCINQKDDVEKSDQVNMMATIYSKATKVAVWLGPDIHNDAPHLFLLMQQTVNAFKMMAAWGDHRSSLAEMDRDAASWLAVAPHPSPFDAIVNPQGEDKDRVIRFFKLPWFSRTWILQEVGLASDADMVWGEQTIPWHTVGLVAMILRQGYLQPNLDRLGIKSDVERAFHAYTTYSPFTGLASFLHVVNNTRRFNATKPEDKLYALLSHPTSLHNGPATASPTWSAYEPVVSLAVRLLNSYQDQFLARQLMQSSGQHADNNLPSSPFMRADYTKPVSQVYQDFALSHINKTDSLEILSAVQHDPTGNTPLFSPSWVPRWDYFIDTPTLGLSSSKHFATKNKRPIITPSPDVPNSLRVRGLLFSRIVRYSQLLSSSQFDLPLPDDTPSGPDSPMVQDRWPQNPISHIWMMFGLFSAPAYSYPVLPLMSADTASGPIDIIDRRAANIHRAYMRAWVAGKDLSETDGFELEADADAYWRRLFWGSEVETDDDKQDEVGHEIRWKRYRNSAAQVCNQRRFFMTKRGFFGIGPGTMRRDDFVAVLLGMDVPVVLREVEEDGDVGLEERRERNLPVPMERKFEVVGECYVDGLMQGQLADYDFVRDVTLV